MGKRSSFERREADFYPTPRAAVLPLIPYLRPAASRPSPSPVPATGDLVRHLEGFGLRCVYAGDIRTGQDALGATTTARSTQSSPIRPTAARRAAQADRALPEHRANVAVARLRTGIDHAGGAVPAALLGHRGDGRVKLIKGSKHTGKDDHRLVQVRYQA